MTHTHTHSSRPEQVTVNCVRRVNGPCYDWQEQTTFDRQRELHQFLVGCWLQPDISQRRCGIVMECSGSEKQWFHYPSTEFQASAGEQQVARGVMDVQYTLQMGPSVLPGSRASEIPPDSAVGNHQQEMVTLVTRPEHTQWLRWSGKRRKSAHPFDLTSLARNRNKLKFFRHVTNFLEWLFCTTRWYKMKVVWNSRADFTLRGCLSFDVTRNVIPRRLWGMPHSVPQVHTPSQYEGPCQVQKHHSGILHHTHTHTHTHTHNFDK